MLKQKLQYCGCNSIGSSNADAKSWLIGKDSDAGKDWRQEEKGMTDEMVGWHHRLNGHEFEQAPGDGKGQGGLECCSPWGHKESDRLSNWTELKKYADDITLMEESEEDLKSLLMRVKGESEKWLELNIKNI